MYVALIQGELFCLDFEHGVLEWKTSKIRPTRDDKHTFGDDENMISSSGHNLETAKKEFKSWVKNKVYTQVSDESQPRISIRWVYTYKNLNEKQVCKAIMASNHWMCKSMDIKTAFLLSKELDLLVYLDPPKEANVPPGYI